MSTPPPIDGIVLDLDGTMYAQGPVRRGMMIRLLGHAVRRPAAAMRTLRLIGAYRRAQESLRVAGAGGLAEGQIAEACRQTGADPAWAARAIAEWMEERPLDLVGRHMRPDLPDFLNAARQKGLRLAVCSDYPAEAKLAAMGVRHFFDAVRCAQDRDVGVFKPNPLGLRRTCEVIGVATSRAVYVGDRDIDAQAASAAGMRAVIIGSTVPSFAALGRTLGF